ncbi:MAG: DUF192 domain-containing protein [Candidatus Altiarchaeota archaeon]
MVEIVNETRGFVISADAQMRDTPEGRRKGLMGSERMDVVLKVAWDSRILPMIHMFGMRYPIDVVWVNGRMEAVDVRRGLPPSRILRPITWRMYAPKSPAKYVIEFGKGGIKDTAVGDRISFK